MRKAIGAAALVVALMAAPAFATIGGPGDDTIHGTPGDDELTGGRGDDIIFSGFGADFVKGGAGDDLCYVNARDTVRGCEVEL
jgi:Hemolysin-type calcium-binding repeat (2 copies).